MPPLTGDPNSHPASEFAEGLAGTCACGSIRVTIRDKHLFDEDENGRPVRRGHLCHCSNCRKTSGSFLSINLLIEAEKVDIIDAEGTLKKYLDYNTGSGNPVARYFCAVDGNPIKSETERFPGKVILKTGIFPRIPAPELEGFALHRHPWEPSFQGTSKFTLSWGSEKLDESGAQ